MEIEKLGFKANMSKKFMRSYLNQQARHSGAHCNPSYRGDIGRKITM
jgi:hypothetical protein